MELLFQPFSQVDSSNTRRFGGSGLGLSIVRSITERMGGHVGVESSPDHGSRFWFELPLQSVAESDEQRNEGRLFGQPSCNEQSVSLGRILVVEDNPMNRRVVERILTKSNFETVSVEDGSQAVVTFENAGTSFDAILMDLQMPVMDGLEATHRIREIEAKRSGRRTPIIALTANAFDSDRQASLAAGMDDFITKPVNAEALLVALNRHTALRREEQ
jgi:CheY-like chemotaxis protein